MQLRMVNPSPVPGPDSNPFPVEFLFLGLNTHKIGVAVIDRRLRFSAINCLLAEMNRLPPEAHPGKSLHEILGPLAAKVVPSLEHVFTTRQALPNIPLSGKLRTQPEPVQWLQFFFPLLGTCGRVVEVGAFVVERKSTSTSQASDNSVSTAQNPEGAMNSAIVLTVREQDVLRLLAIGNSNKEVSSILGISVKTVETYRFRLMLKINVPSLTHLVHYAIRHKYVQLRP
jgi:DNA-binding CsgD family transcriptional regulator